MNEFRSFAVAAIIAILSLGRSFAQTAPVKSEFPYITSSQWASTTWDNNFQPLFLNLFKLRWHDEFDRCDIGVDPRPGESAKFNKTHNWYAEIRPARRANMVGPHSQVSPFACSDGALSITLSNPTGKQWQGGELRAFSSRGAGIKFTYGYVEARIKFPKPPPGLVPWPAFWFLSVPPKGVPQTRMELDVVEPGLTSSTDIEAQSTTIHEWPDTIHPELGQIGSHVFTGFRPPYTTFDDEWHTYGFEKLRRAWIVFRDGTEFGRYPVLGAEMDYPMYPLIDVALNFDASSADLRSKYIMYVDYIRIYEPTAMMSTSQK